MLTYQKLSFSHRYNSKLTQSQSEADSDSDPSADSNPTIAFNPASKEYSTQADSNDVLTYNENWAIASATILIVDDTPNNLQVLFSYLETAGFQVLLAEDGNSAIQIAQTQKPDLILLDVLMPEIDGFATCRQLKSQASTKEIPIIFLTALSETVNKVQGFKLGGVDYITKPIEQEEVLARIQTHLKIQKMGRVLAIQNQELQQSLQFEALVRRITDKVRDSLDEAYCLRTATEELATVLKLGSCQVELYDSQTAEATIAYEHSKNLPNCLGEKRKINDLPELYQQLLQKLPVQLVEAMPQFEPQGIQVTRLACPIFDDRGVIGNLWGLRPPGELFTPLEIRLMQQVASQCAIAMRQARLYANSNQQVVKLARLNQLKDNFLRTVSHELKAPLSSIQLAAQTLESLINTKQNPRKSPLFGRVFRIFRESCQQQKQLTDDLLTLGYIDANAKIVQPEMVDLNLWLANLVEPFLKFKTDQQPKFILDLSQKKLNLLIDPIILERIVQELLNNAFQSTPVGGKITLQTRATKSKVTINVINTGNQIPPDEQELVFTQFYRLASNDPKKNNGLNLGLTLVKKLTETLKGTIDLKSNQKETVFSVKFTLEPN